MAWFHVNNVTMICWHKLWVGSRCPQIVWLQEFIQDPRCQYEIIPFDGWWRTDSCSCPYKRFADIVPLQSCHRRPNSSQSTGWVLSLTIAVHDGEHIPQLLQKSYESWFLAALGFPFFCYWSDWCSVKNVELYIACWYTDKKNWFRLCNFAENVSLLKRHFGQITFIVQKRHLTSKWGRAGRWKWWEIERYCNIIFYTFDQNGAGSKCPREKDTICGFDNKHHLMRQRCTHTTCTLVARLTPALLRWNRIYLAEKPYERCFLILGIKPLPRFCWDMLRSNRGLYFTHSWDEGKWKNTEICWKNS